jgi:hypothetical protein
MRAMCPVNVILRDMISLLRCDEAPRSVVFYILLSIFYGARGGVHG